MHDAMRGYRLLQVATVAVALAAVGCGHAANARGGPAVHARRAAPAPAYPDLGAVMERFYQQVEDGHWRFADAMLTPRYRASLGPDGVRARYEPLADIDVTLQQRDPRTVITALSALDSGTPRRRRRYRETVKLAWDGEQWLIDSIARSSVTGGTR